MGRAVIRYTDTRRSSGELARSTTDHYAGVLLRFADTVGNETPVDRVTSRHVERWVDTLSHLADATKKHYIDMVRTFFAWAVEYDLVRRSPCKVKGPRLGRPIPRAMPGTDISALVGKLPDARADLIVSLMVQEGLRRMEVAYLDRSDIDMGQRSLHVRVAKGGFQRVLWITDETMECLHRYLTTVPSTGGRLVRSKLNPSAGVGPSAIGDLISDWMYQAGVKERAHDGKSGHALRHTAATDALRGGAHILDVQAMLGHVNIANTRRYLPLVVKSLEDAMGGRTYRPEITPA